MRATVATEEKAIVTLVKSAGCSSVSFQAFADRVGQGYRLGLHLANWESAVLITVLRGTVPSMKRVVRMFSSFEDADAADDQFYNDLTPEERLDILLELVERHRSTLGEAASRFERVHRIVELAQR